MGKSWKQFWKATAKRIVGHGEAIKTVQNDPPGHEHEPKLVPNSVDNFYNHQLQNNLRRLERFARQSQSRQIQEVFARGASKGRRTLLGLVNELEDNVTTDFTTSDASSLYDVRLMVALAGLVATTARDDLETDIAVQIFGFVKKYWGPSAFSRENILQYIEALGSVRRYQEQSQMIDDFNVRSFDALQVELLKIDRHRFQSSLDVWLQSANALYESLGMSHIRLLDDESLPVLDRLSSATSKRVTGPRISVIMPTYKPGPGIRTAIRSLLEQTWENLEVIIVDDGSPREYEATLESLGIVDDRVRIIRQTQNLGPYVARNVGLAAATGELITTHDDDDWSHPDKLTIQASSLMESTELVANTTAHVRTTADMLFTRINSKPRHAQKNYSSLMFKREIIDEIGPWDEVNRGGDSEFEARILRTFGKSRSVDLKDIPASFTRVWHGSLTSGEMRRGYQAYSRQLYFQSYSQWHKHVYQSERRVQLDNTTTRPFPVPSTLSAGKRGADLGTFDIVFVSDFYVSAKDSKTVLANLDAAAQAGFRTGFMLLESPRTPTRERIHPRIFELQHSGKIQQVSHDDHAKVRLLIVYDASVGMFLDQLESTVEAYKAIAVWDDSPKVRGKEVREPLLIHQALLNLDRCFNSRFKLVASSVPVRERISRVTPPTRMVGETFVWNSAVDLNEPRNFQLPSDRAVVGYHSFANMFRWPSNMSTFESVYVSDKYQTMLYGQLQPLVDKYGEEALKLVDIMDSTEFSLEDFWERIHFWVYYPDDRLVETQTWKPVLEALQAGKVVILPERLRAVYGDSALYASHETIEQTVIKYTEDTTAYLEQARRGQNFVAVNFSKQSYARMITTLLS